MPICPYCKSYSRATYCQAFEEHCLSCHDHFKKMLEEKHKNECNLLKNEINHLKETIKKYESQQPSTIINNTYNTYIQINNEDINIIDDVLETRNLDEIKKIREVLLSKYQDQYSRSLIKTKTITSIQDVLELVKWDINSPYEEKVLLLKKTLNDITSFPQFLSTDIPYIIDQAKKNEDVFKQIVAYVDK